MLPLIPKLRVPLEMGRGGLRTVEQGSVDEVAGCVYAILATPQGTRLEDPAFGIEDPTFEQQPLDTTPWLEAIATYEPRARVETGEEIGELTARITAEVGAR